MNIVRQLRKAERELERKAHNIGQELDRLRNAITALGHGRATKTTKKRKRRKMSAATRRRISATMRKKWATKKKA